MTWYAGNNSTNNGSLGWIFQAAPVPVNISVPAASISIAALAPSIVIGPPVGAGPSAPMRLTRYASYRRDSGAFIRQVSPGVFLRASSEELLPNVVVGQEEVGSAEVLAAKDNPLAKQILGDRAVRKIRRELRRLQESGSRLAEQERLLQQSNAALREMDAKIKAKLAADAADEEDLEFIVLNL